MMKVAFYAPMKPANHPVPSGDRRIAQLLIRALSMAGSRIEVVSRLRSYNRDGDTATQRRIVATARQIVERYLARSGAPPDVWFTYHCYHKAPDLLGPAVSRALGIPYIIADASIAPKRASGSWAEGYAAARQAILRADRLIAFDPNDIPMLRMVRPDTAIVSMPPLAHVAPIRTEGSKAEENGKPKQAMAEALGLDPDLPWLASVAMMRPGAKLDSYRVMAQALARIADKPWSLLIAGDGPARTQVEAAFATHLDDRGRVRFLGQLDADGLTRVHRACDLAIWPGIDEGFCMALVEAQVSGLPVIAGNRPGIASVVADGETGLLTPVGDVAAFAGAIETLLDNAARRSTMSQHAARTAIRFGLESAARQLNAVLADARATRIAA
jgi:glycosyltransferase involved in cell wall biosynthesis